MSDVVLTCCRDEEDAIEAFVLFYLEMGFDAVYVVDNGSTDSTADRVRALVARGLPVHLRVDPRLGYERHLSEHYDWAGRDARPRWLFFLDCDEFVLFPPGGARPWLDAVPPAYTSLRLREREMLPFADGRDRGPGGFLLTPRARPAWGDTFKEMTRWTPGARVRGGKHRIDLPGRAVLEVAEPFIRHYKYRSPRQAARKEANRVQAHATYTDRELEWISAFGVETSRGWIEHCRREEAAQGWRVHFDAALPAAEDGEMARWAERFLKTAAEAGLIGG